MPSRFDKNARVSSAAPARRRWALAGGLLLLGLVPILCTELRSPRDPVSLSEPERAPTNPQGSEDPPASDEDSKRRTESEQTRDEPSSATMPVRVGAALEFVDAITRARLEGVHVDEYLDSKFITSHSSNERGVVDLALADACSHVFDCTRDGYAPIAIESHVFERDSIQGVLTVELRRAGRLRVVVAKPRGEPIERVFVEAYPWDAAVGRRADTQAGWPVFQHPDAPLGPPGPRSPRSWTGPDGTLELESLPVGVALVVTVSNVVVSQSQVTTIPPDQGLAEVRFVAQPGVTVRGRLVDSMGSPIARAILRIRNAQGLSIPYAPEVTNDNGQFEIGAVPDGTHALDLSACGSGNRPIEVRGKDLDLGDVLIEGGAIIAGQVICDDEARAFDPGLTHRLALTAEVAGVTVQRLQFGRNLTFQGRVPPGKLNLVVRDRGEVVATAIVEAPEEGIALPVTGTTGRIRLQLNDVNAGLVRIALRSIQGGTPKGRTILRSTEHFLHEATWEEGRLLIRGIPPGDYEVMATVPGLGAASATAAVQRGETTDVGPLSIGYGSLRIVATFKDGIPAARQSVLLEPLISPISGRRIERLDDGGLLSLSQLDCGEWRVAALTGADEARVKGEVVRLQAGQTSEVRLTFDADASLHVTIVDATAPVPRARVRVHFLNGGRDGGTDRLLVAEDATDSNGKATFSGLAPGSYLIATETDLPDWGRVARAATVSLARGQKELRLEWDSRGTKIRIFQGAESFTDLAAVRAVSCEFTLTGRVLDRAEGLVSFPTADPIEMLKIRVSSTTGSETQGAGGEYVFAQVEPTPAADHRRATICTGRIKLHLASGEAWPEMTVLGSGSLSTPGIYLGGVRLCWRDVAAGTREFWGFPPGVELSPFGSVEQDPDSPYRIPTNGIEEWTLPAMRGR